MRIKICPVLYFNIYWRSLKPVYYNWRICFKIGKCGNQVSFGWNYTVFKRIPNFRSGDPIWVARALVCMRHKLECVVFTRDIISVRPSIQGVLSTGTLLLISLPSISKSDFFATMLTNMFEFTDVVRFRRLQLYVHLLTATDSIHFDFHSNMLHCFRTAVFS